MNPVEAVGSRLWDRLTGKSSAYAEDLPVEDGGAADGGYLVPASTTISQILDYAHGSQGDWPLNFFIPGLNTTRDQAITWAVLSRCVTLVSGGVASMLTEVGNLRVVDPGGMTIRTRRAEAALELLTWSPDGGMTPAYSFHEDCVSDYMLDGNALVLPDKQLDGTPTSLKRYVAWDADLTFDNNGMGVYRMTPVDGPVASVRAAQMDVIHARWPRLLRYSRTRSTREGFAIPPVVALRPALDIGLQGDRYIREWFTRGARSKLHFNFELQENEQEPSVEDKAELVKWIETYTASRRPMVTWGANSSLLSDVPQDDQVKDLREFQIMEAARFFGIPAPLIGSMVTEWGPAIEQLARLFWRFCLRHHLARYLTAMELRLLRRGQRFQVDPTALLRGDADAISKLTMALQGDSQRPAIATRSELRHAAGLPVEDEQTSMENERKARENMSKTEAPKEGGDMEGMNGAPGDPEPQDVALNGKSV